MGPCYLGDLGQLSRGTGGPGSNHFEDLWKQRYKLLHALKTTSSCACACCDNVCPSLHTHVHQQRLLSHRRLSEELFAAHHALHTMVGAEYAQFKTHTHTHTHTQRTHKRWNDKLQRHGKREYNSNAKLTNNFLLKTCAQNTAHIFFNPTPSIPSIFACMMFLNCLLQMAMSPSWAWNFSALSGSWVNPWHQTGAHARKSTPSCGSTGGPFAGKATLAKCPMAMLTLSTTL